MRIITNADDLGLNSTVNDAIFELMDEGLVTSATLLANGGRVAEAAKRTSQYPNCSFGAHLNLTELVPVGGGVGLSRLLDAAGRFSGNTRKVGSLLGLRQAVYQEWCAQIDLLLRLGVPVSHIDGHHHIHTLPSLFPVLKAVQRRYRIRKVRISLNVYSSAEARGRKLLPIPKKIFNHCLRSIYRTRTTDAFMSLNAYCENRQQIAARYRSGEIMLHPGVPSSEEETKILRELGQENPDFKNGLISYNQL